jgi:amidophosphoribosyltransferase
MPTRDELLGSGHSVSEIREHLGVDSLGYLSLEGLQQAVEAAGPFCNACWTGEYVAPLVDLEAGHRVADHSSA